jgi:hypothetical protein
MPSEIDGEAYWDGGYTGNPALYPLVDDQGCRDLVVVQINPIVRRALPRSAARSSTGSTRSPSTPASSRSCAIQLLHQLIEAEGLQLESYRDMRLHLIHADREVEGLSASSKLNAEWGYLTRLRDLGHRWATAFLDANFEAIGERSTFDLDELFRDAIRPVEPADGAIRIRPRRTGHDRHRRHRRRPRAADGPRLSRPQPVVLAPALAALVALVSVDTPLLASYTQVFMGAAGGFIVRYFPLFLLGAIFGKLMEDSGSAEVLARHRRAASARRARDPRGRARCATMTYGGVSLFVVAFAVYPIAAALFRQAGLPKRLIPGTIALGAFTFTMTALPGTPAIQNAIPMPYFGTTPFAAPGLGIVTAW